jgi:hypothetical protein
MIENLITDQILKQLPSQINLHRHPLLPDEFSSPLEQRLQTSITRAPVLEGYSFPRDKYLLGESDLSNADLAHWLALDCAERAVADSGLNGSIRCHQHGWMIAAL